MLWDDIFVAVLERVKTAKKRKMEEKNEYVIVLAMVYTGSHHSYYWNRKTTKKRKTTIKVISGESLELQEELNNRQAVVMPAYIGPSSSSVQVVSDLFEGLTFSKSYIGWSIYRTNVWRKRSCLTRIL